jgi:hypothetical protein
MLPRLEQNLYLLRRVVGGTPGITPLLATPSAMKLVIEGSYSLEAAPSPIKNAFPDLHMLHRPRLTYSKVKVGKENLAKKTAKEPALLE